MHIHFRIKLPARLFIESLYIVLFGHIFLFGCRQVLCVWGTRVCECNTCDLVFFVLLVASLRLSGRY